MRLTFYLAIVVAITTVLIPRSTTRRVVPLVNNGYDIVVAIKCDVTEDPKLIDNLKEILTLASARMYEGTSKRAYFRSVSILLPSTWRNQANYETAGKERSADADIKIAPINRKYGDVPYTKLVSGDCGAPGEYIHLTPGYINDDNGARSLFGDPGKVILHEWGYHRWGLQEEYPDPFGSLQSRFYFSLKTKKWEAVRCSLSTAGMVIRPTGKGKYKTCKLANGFPDQEDCQFVPGFRVKNPAKVSIMDHQGTENVNSFCEKSDDPLHLHNYEAPNKMNVVCGGRSAWEVMREHADFKNGINPARDITTDDVTPNFRLLRRGNDTCRVSLVIDRSGSMSGDLIADLKKGLTKFIQYTVAEGMEIGMSSFESQGTIDCPMRRIEGDVDRKDFIRDCLNQNAGGGTNIGQGLITGIRNLAGNSNGSRIFILTDGQGPGAKEPSVLQALDEAGVIVDVVCYTKYADENMRSLADRYGGAFYFDSDKSSANSLNEAFLKNPCQSDTCEEVFDQVSLQSGAGKLVAEGDIIRGEFSFDETLGKRLHFLVDFPTMISFQADKLPIFAPSIHLTVISPDQSVFSENSTEYLVDQTFKTITLAIPEEKATIGRWRYRIRTRVDDQDYSINVIAGSSSSESYATNKLVGTNEKKPILLAASLKSFRAEFPSPITVYAKATRGGDEPVLYLTVVALVDRPNEDPLYQLPLKDDGIGADREKDDGIYTGQFTAYTAVGRYAFSVMAEGDESRTVVKTYTRAGSWGAAPLITENNIDVLRKPEYVLTPIRGGISRSAPAGAAEMAPPTDGMNEWELNKKLSEGEDLIPPRRIDDLEARLSSNKLLEITWTTPWDESDANATGKYYTMVLMTDKNTINATIVQDDSNAGKIAKIIDLTALEFLPLKGSGAVSVYDATILGVSAYVVAVDAAGNQSPPSNSATASTNATLTPTPTTPTTPTTLIVGLVAGGAVVILAVAAIIVVKKKKKSKVMASRGAVGDEMGL